MGGGGSGGWGWGGVGGGGQRERERREEKETDRSIHNADGRRIVGRTSVIKVIAFVCICFGC
jgi:hypothetical protein